MRTLLLTLLACFTTSLVPATAFADYPELVEELESKRTTLASAAEEDLRS